MANHGSSNAFILYGGVNLTPITFQIDEEAMADVDDTTPIGRANPRIEAVGSTSATVKVQGFYDDAVDQAAGMLAGASTDVMTIGSDGSTQGAGVTVYSGDVRLDYARVIARKKMHRANSNYQSSGAVDFATNLQPLGAVAGTGDGDALDNTTSTSNGGAIAYHLTALDLDGGSALTVKVQHSADNSAWTDLATFTAATEAPVAQRKTISGVVDRYTRAVWTFTDGTSPTATLEVAIARF